MTVHLSAFPQTVLLTGGTSGLGYACARTIAASRPDWHLVIASRNERQGMQTVTTLKQQTGNQQIAWLSLDLASLTSVRALVREFAGRSLPPLHAIVSEDSPG